MRVGPWISNDEDDPYYPRRRDSARRYWMDSGEDADLAAIVGRDLDSTEEEPLFGWRTFVPEGMTKRRMPEGRGCKTFEEAMAAADGALRGFGAEFPPRPPPPDPLETLLFAPAMERRLFGHGEPGSGRPTTALCESVGSSSTGEKTYSGRWKLYYGTMSAFPVALALRWKNQRCVLSTLLLAEVLADLEFKNRKPDLDLGAVFARKPEGWELSIGERRHIYTNVLVASQIWGDEVTTTRTFVPGPEVDVLPEMALAKIAEFRGLGKIIPLEA